MREPRTRMVIYGYRMSMERPKECASCRYWKNRKLGCVKGANECPYLKREMAQAEKCRNCSYRKKGEPCVSAVCYQDLVADRNKERRMNA